MSNSIIKIENLGKKYIIAHQQQQRANYIALRDVLINNVKSLGQNFITLFQKSSSLKGQLKEEFWALKDVSFEVKRGEVIGIIGRNGAGKSTLLKILSRIIEPTTGRAILKGQVASLLEVGTGFHPELTGRENIYLNGAILGMTKVEIKKNFDEIVAFAEVEKFLDTPVKHYSSGMYVRLAFAVAAHLEPEILVVDEVLAVGDAAFQKKCLGKMGDVATKEGKTILFVSHNMAIIQNLCEKSILLDKGRLLNYDLTESVINQYINSITEQSKIDIKERQDRKGNGKFRFISVEFLSYDGQAIDTITTGTTLKIKVLYYSEYAIQLNIHRISIGFKDQVGNLIFNCPSDVGCSQYPVNYHQNLNQTNILICTIPKFPLSEGLYRFNLFSSINEEITDWIQDAGTLQVISGDFYGTGKLPPRKNQGVLVDFKWEIP